MAQGRLDGKKGSRFVPSSTLSRLSVAYPPGNHPSIHPFCSALPLSGDGGYVTYLRSTA